MQAEIGIGPDGRIWAKIPYANGNGPAWAKMIPGCRPKFEKAKVAGKKDKFIAWTYPLDMGTCRAFRDVFGSGLQIRTELADWAREEIARETELIALRSKQEIEQDFPVLRKFAQDLRQAIANRKYQEVGTQFILQGQRVIVADQPGLGKTLETLAALTESGAKRILIVAPRTAMETVWANEIVRWTSDSVTIADGTAWRRELAIQAASNIALAGKRSYLVINPEMLRTKKRIACVVCGGKDPENCPKKGTSLHMNVYDYAYPGLFSNAYWDAVVVDECHRALIGKNVMSKSITQTRLGAMLLPTNADTLKIALSGTPYRGKPELLWGILNWLKPDVFTSYWRWAETYFDVAEDGWGGRVIGELRSDKAAQYDRSVAPYIIRRTKAEVAPDLPPKMYGGTPLITGVDRSIGVWLPLESQQMKQYGQMADETNSSVNFDDGRKLDAIGVLAQLTRLKQFAVVPWSSGVNNNKHNVSISPDVANSNKYQWLLEFLNERAEEGIKVVVASQFTQVANAFAEQLQKDGHRSYVLTGETKQRDRATIVEDFQTNPDSPKIFFINTQAGGVAITLDAADDLVFLDETWIPDDQEQVEDRLHRVSRQHQVTIWYVRSLDTIEEEICRITAERDAAVKELLDGSRGVEIARRLLMGG